MAGLRSGAAALRARPRPVRGGSASRRRHRRRRRRARPRSGGRDDQLRGLGPHPRAHRHDPDGRRLCGDAHASREPRRGPRRRGRRRWRRRRRRGEWRAGVATAIRPSRRSHCRGSQRLRRPARVPPVEGRPGAACPRRRSQCARSRTRAGGPARRGSRCGRSSCGESRLERGLRRGSRLFGAGTGGAHGGAGRRACVLLSRRAGDCRGAARGESRSGDSGSSAPRGRVAGTAARRLRRCAPRPRVAPAGTGVDERASAGGRRNAHRCRCRSDQTDRATDRRRAEPRPGRACPDDEEQAKRRHRRTSPRDLGGAADARRPRHAASHAHRGRCRRAHDAADARAAEAPRPRPRQPQHSPDERTGDERWRAVAARSLRRVAPPRAARGLGRPCPGAPAAPPGRSDTRSYD